MEAHSLPSFIILDPVGGVSGDMFIAAILDAWPSLTEPVFDALRNSSLPATARVSLVERHSNGLAGRGFVFEGKSAAPTGAYSVIRRRLSDADLSAPIRAHALSILRLLAEAEAAVHRVAIDDVHFHELADWDTQADIVAAAAVIDRLAGARWHCRPLPLGTGTVRTAHGLLPMPAPAAAQLLAGFAFRGDDGVPGERVTPTGAAILRHLAPRFDAGESPGILIATGIGAGSRQLPGIPNVLRVLGFTAGQSADDVLVIEFDIDDQSPEELATGLERLRLVPGVRDVATFQGIGKKARWLQAVRVMADPALRDAVVAAVFDETATLGVRLRREERAVLARRTVVVTDDDDGSVRVKVAERLGRRTAKPEADDIAARGQGAEGRARLRRTAIDRALRATESEP
jgi:pyridinium-3,5-bisthiocarboxylic acid mononucleotide nickel chelatase